MRIWARASKSSDEWDDFRKWFAWYPVLVGKYWVWLQTIERRDWHGEETSYRDYRFADEDEDDEI